jgi:hypothetical protein
MPSLLHLDEYKFLALYLYFTCWITFKAVRKTGKFFGISVLAICPDEIKGKD